MKKLKYKFFACLCITTLLVSTISISALAKSNRNYDIVKAKHDLMKKAVLEEQLKNKPIELFNNKHNSTQKEEDILLKMTAEGANEYEIESTMRNYGLYKLHIPIKNSTNNRLTRSISSSSMEMSTPNIYYDGRNQEWIVVGGGHWEDDDWLEHVPLIWKFLGNEGSTVEVGGKDAFGIGFTNTSGTYAKLN